MSIDTFDAYLMHGGCVNESTEYTLSVLKSCHDAINEGSADYSVISTASSYTQSLIVEMLENVKNALMQFYQNVISALNNYVINTASLVSKYKEFILNRYDKLEKPLVYNTYEYTDLFNLPKDNQQTVEIAHAGEELVNMTLDWSDAATYSAIQNRVDKAIQSFSHAILGFPINIEDVKFSTKKRCESKMRGKAIQKVLTKSDLPKFIDDIIKFKKTKDEINVTKRGVITHYNELKKSYLAAFRVVPTDKGGIRRMRDPAGAELLDRQALRYSQGSTQVVRLFDSVISIYRVAYDTKLSILMEKVQSQRTILDELMTATSIFSAVHAKKNATMSRSKQRKDLIIRT